MEDQQVMDTASTHFEQIAATIDSSNPQKSLSVIRQLIPNFNDCSESVHDFLHALLPSINRFLATTEPQFENNDVQKARFAALKFLRVVPVTQIPSSMIQNVYTTTISIMSSDNESNALLCLPVIFDLHQKYRNELESHVQLFLTFFSNIYVHLQRNVASTFQIRTGTPTTPLTIKSIMIKSRQSFRVLSECPMLVLLLFKAYPTFFDASLGNLVPLMIKALRLEVPRSAITLKSLFAEFIGAQVKTLSFLTYVLRGYLDIMRQYSDDLSRSVVHLLVNVPAEAIESRRELLLATRHILATDCKKGFLNKVDYFLKDDARMLIGPGRIAQAVLRPLASSALSDLIIFIKNDLSFAQLSKVISFFSRNLNDDSLPISLQTSSVNLLFALVDPAYRIDATNGSGRILLSRIMHSIVGRLEHLNKLVSILVKKRSSMSSFDEHQKRMLPPVTATWATNSQANEYPCANVYLKNPIDNFFDDCEHYHGGEAKMAGGERETRSFCTAVRDTKALISTIVFGLKTVVWCIVNQKKSNNSENKTSASLDIRVEYELVVKLLMYALPCIQIFTLHDASDSHHHSHHRQQQRDAKQAQDSKPQAKNEHSLSSFNENEVLENFASVFTVLDVRMFQKVFARHIGLLFTNVMNQHSRSVLIIPQHFLENRNVSKEFADILLTYLLGHMSRLSPSSSHESNCFLNLFKIVIKSLTIFPDNETAVRPYLIRIIESCLKNAVEAEDAFSYLDLLRIFFHGIGGGKFELLYKEMLPLLPDLFRTLLQFVRLEPSNNISDMAVELCLTVPARLSSMLPFLSKLVEVIAKALVSSPRIIQIALRTLEFWVDNLELEFLYEHLEPRISDIMRPLCALISTQSCMPLPHIESFYVEPSPFADTAIKILGALGGRNRAFLLKPYRLSVLDQDIRGPALLVYFSGSENGPAISSFSLQHLYTQLAPLLGPDSSMPLGVQKATLEALWNAIEGLLVEIAVSDSVDMSAVGSIQMNESNEIVEQAVLFGHLQRRGEERAFECILATILRNSSPDCEFLKRLQAKFVCIYADMFSTERKFKSSSCFDPFVFLDTIFDVMSSQVHSEANNAYQVFESVLADLINSCGGQKKAGESRAINRCLASLAHCCHQHSWWSRLAGARGLKKLTTSMSANWLFEHKHDLIRTLLFTLSDEKSALAIEAGTTASAALDTIIAHCCRLLNAPLSTGSESISEQEQTNTINSFVTLLAPDLISPIQCVRSHIHRLLDVVATSRGVTVAKLLVPFQKLLLAPVLQRLLHTVPPSVRLGYISAATYALQLNPPLIQISSDLLDILSSLANEISSEDSSETNRSTRKPGRTRFLMLQKVETIKLLTAALKAPQLDTRGGECGIVKKASQLRNAIVAAFFTALCSTQEEVADAAYVGLALACEQEKLPKQLLQQCLRPILSNFSEYQKLSVHLLKMLSRLLELLKDCFNVTLGEKLFEHLHQFTKALSDLSQARLKATVDVVAGDSVLGSQASPSASSAAVVQARLLQGSEAAIPAAILETFHLLPQAPEQLLAKLVQRVLQLEQILPALGVYGGPVASYQSPFRTPLLRYLSRYKAETIAYFLAPQRLVTPQLSALFHEMLRDKGGTEIADTLQHLSDQLVLSTFKFQSVAAQNAAEQASINAISKADIQELQNQGVKLVHILASRCPEWLGQARNVVQCLLALWEARVTLPRQNHSCNNNGNNGCNGSNGEMVSVELVHENRLIMECLVTYTRVLKQDVIVLWKLLSAFLQRSFGNLTDLHDFYENEVAKQPSIEHTKLILREFLKSIYTRGAPELLKVQALVRVLIPVFKHVFRSSLQEKAVDIQCLNEFIVSTFSGSDIVRYSDEFKVELLHLLDLLLQFIPERCQTHQVLIFQFIWSAVSLPNARCQLPAFVAAARFIHSFAVPLNIRIALFAATLKLYSSETLNSFNITMRILLPRLPKHKDKIADEDRAFSYPTWIHHLLYLLSSEHQLMSIARLLPALQLIIIHEEYFFVFRRLFIPVVISLLPRFGFKLARPFETCFLAISIVETIMKWHTREISEKDAMDVCETFNETDNCIEISSPVDIDVTAELNTFTNCEIQSTIDDESIECETFNDHYRMSVSSSTALVAFTLRNALASGSQPHFTLAQTAYDTFINTLSEFPHSDIRFESLLNTTSIEGILCFLRILQAILSTHTNIARVIRVNAHALDASLLICYTAADERAWQMLVSFWKIVRQCGAFECLKDIPLLQVHLNIVFESIGSDDRRSAGLAVWLMYSHQTEISFLPDTIAMIDESNAEKHTQALARELLSLSRETISSESSSNRDILERTFLKTLIILQHNPQWTNVSRKDVFKSFSILASKTFSVRLLKPIVEVLHKNAINQVPHSETLLFSASELGNLLRQLATRSFIDKLKDIQLPVFTLIVDIFCDESNLQVRTQLKPVLKDSLFIGLRCSHLDIRHRIANYMVKSFGSSNSARAFGVLMTIFSESAWMLLVRGGKNWLASALELVLAITESRCESGRLSSAISLSSSATTWSKYLLVNIRQVMHHSTTLTSLLWRKLVPPLWAVLNSEQRTILTCHIDKMMCSDAHDAIAGVFGNPIHETLLALKSCSPLPLLQPLYLTRLARVHNSWPTVCSMLERRLLQDPLEQGKNSEVAHALARLYSFLNERDVLCGLWRNRSCSELTRAALAFEQFGLWPRAQDMFFQALAGAHSLEDSRLNTEDAFHMKLEVNTSPILSKPVGQAIAEARLCEEEWLHCAKQLDQWDSLLLFAHTVGQTELQMECAAKLGDFVQLNKLQDSIFTPHPQQKLHVAPSTHMIRLSLVCHSRAALPSATDFEVRCTSASSAIIREFSVLPPVISCTHSHLLGCAHQFVELREAHSMLSDRAPLQNDHEITLANLNLHIQRWRQRLPNDFEGLPMWHDIMFLRMHVFERLAQIHNPGEDLTASARGAALKNVSDRCWTIVKLAQVARKQQLACVCLCTLKKLSSESIMDSDSAFERLREQIRVCMQSPTEMREALQLVSSVNLDYFSSWQKAELFRLKGEALQHLGLGDDSNIAFATATSVCDTHGRAWLSWANFCDRVFALKKERQWAEYAVTCFLHAVAYGEARARLMLTRVMWLMSYDTHDGIVIRAFHKYADQLPLWSWLLWIPQLLSSLSRNEGVAAKSVLKRLGRIYPQALHYTVRAFLIEKREIRGSAAASQANAPVQPASSTDSPGSRARATTPNGGPTLAAKPLAGPPTSLSSFQLVEEVVRTLRDNHPSLVTEVERMLDEVSKRFKPEPEEELLGAVHALLLKCFKQVVASPDNVPESLRAMLARVCNKFFSSESGSSNPRHALFVGKYKALFERDFLLPLSQENTSIQSSRLTALMRRLKRWKCHLLFRVSQKETHRVKLEKLSPYLARFQTYDVEVPGQYLKDEEPSTDQNVTICRFESSVYVRHSHGFSHRRIGVVGSNGCKYYFFIQYSISHITRSDERMMQLYTIVNRLMAQYKQTCRRELMFSVPLVVPLTHRLRLLQTAPELVSLEEVYEHICTSRSFDPDRPLMEYRNCVGRARVWSESAIKKARLEVFKKIQTELLPEDAFSTFISSTVQHPDELWAFRKQFAKQLALSSFLAYVFKIGDRALHKIIISKRTGEISNSEFYPSYSSQNAIESLEAVPFRLSPNLEYFIGPFVRDGIFASSLIASAACLLKHQDVLKNYLYLFIRDDLLSWHATRVPLISDAAQRSLEYDFRLQISANTLQILKGIQSLMPSPKPEKTKSVAEPINKRVKLLIKKSTDLNNLSSMNPVWHPWF